MLVATERGAATLGGDWGIDPSQVPRMTWLLSLEDLSSRRSGEN